MMKRNTGRKPKRKYNYRFGVRGVNSYRVDIRAEFDISKNVEECKSWLAFLNMVADEIYTTQMWELCNYGHTVRDGKLYDLDSYSSVRYWWSVHRAPLIPNIFRSVVNGISIEGNKLKVKLTDCDYTKRNRLRNILGAFCFIVGDKETDWSVTFRRIVGKRMVYSRIEIAYVW